MYLAMRSCVDYKNLTNMDLEKIINLIVEDLQANAMPFKNYVYEPKVTHQIIRKHLTKQLKLCDVSQCACTPDETTGTTTVRCCNICGKPAESFWHCG